uniref:Inositol polyphosphate-4-phosphatase type II B n=1 Tax=Ovis aries TaxID=9940 RepID=A0AC11CSX0_SHEEP
MEIKEEGASEEGQNFLPTPQANDTGDFQFTSIQKTPNEPQLEFILGKKFLFIYSYKCNMPFVHIVYNFRYVTDITVTYNIFLRIS